MAQADMACPTKVVGMAPSNALVFDHEPASELTRDRCRWASWAATFATGRRTTHGWPHSSEPAREEGRGPHRRSPGPGRGSEGLDRKSDQTRASARPAANRRYAAGKSHC